MKSSVVATIVASVSLALCTFVDTASSDQSGAARSYTCGFDSSDYIAPGTNNAVNVGGIFNFSIDSHGIVTQGDATMSVDDGGAGPAVCTYGSGTGQINVAALTGSFGSASLTFAPQNGNSAVCPSGDGSLTFSPTTSGMKFIYTNSSGFVGQGTCLLPGTPTASSAFTCKYAVKDAVLGTGAGLGTVVFVPPLNAKTFIYSAAIFGGESYPAKVCPFFGPVGVASYSAKKGKWGAPSQISDPSCPATPFSEVTFTTSAQTILITAPGISEASCEPQAPANDNAAKLSVTPDSLNFGSQKVGTTSSPQTLTITNVGTDDVNIVAYAAFGDFDEDNDCPETLGKGASCHAQVTFTPKGKGTRKGKLQISSDASPGQVTIPLSGSGS